MALQGLWGSFFSHHGSGAFKFKGRLWSKVGLVANAAIAAEVANAMTLEQEVRQLYQDSVESKRV